VKRNVFSCFSKKPEKLLQLCTVQCTCIGTELTVTGLRTGFCLTEPIFLCCISCISCLLPCCIILICWDERVVIEAWSLGPLLPSMLWHCWRWVIWPVKLVPDMTYNVFSGTLNPAQSINQSTGGGGGAQGDAMTPGGHLQSLGRQFDQFDSRGPTRLESTYATRLAGSSSSAQSC